jgi:hypothetical protein
MGFVAKGDACQAPLPHPRFIVEERGDAGVEPDAKTVPARRIPSIASRETRLRAPLSRGFAASRLALINPQPNPNLANADEFAKAVRLLMG